MDMKNQDPSGLDGVPAESLNPRTTPYDYLIVGSGPGGAPLACRLALAGMNVLVLEAGVDPGGRLASEEPNLAAQRQLENQHLMYYCPGMHGASTEPHLYPQCPSVPTAWGFSVRHNTAGGEVYYPRASALGGCMAHHAMISIYGSDSDWQRIADLTGDASWAPGKMRNIYQQIERFRFSDSLTWFERAWETLLTKLNPARNAAGERGEHGWLDVVMADPKLALDDPQLLRLITHALIDESGLPPAEKYWRLFKRFLRGRLYRDFDLNDAERMRDNPEGLALVPLAVAPSGVRRGPRDFLLETRRELLAKRRELQSKIDGTSGVHEKAVWESELSLTGRLDIATGVLVCRVQLEPDLNGGPPRAVGVVFQRGVGLYAASLPASNPAPANEEACYCRREVILSGGAFNSPQLLMLSGIGDPQKLGHSLSSQANQRIVPLPGVGANLMDRCEISVISTLQKPFALLKGVELRPDAKDDPAMAAWKAEEARAIRQGVYRGNGAAIVILRRSHPRVTQPDLIILGFPAAFRGYYEGWSKEMLQVRKGGTEAAPAHNLWSWVLLKAYTENRGQVQLRSGDPRHAPDINFKYFGEGRPPATGSDPDLEALVSGVKFVRQLNRGLGELHLREHQPTESVVDDSPELRQWIREEAWGHHACGTCRLGADAWQADPAQLKDKTAVVDSKFRVHGVRNLRVVDASIFPFIPGYFIAMPVCMVSEKAATTLLNELSD